VNRFLSQGLFILSSARQEVNTFREIFLRISQSMISLISKDDLRQISSLAAAFS